MSLVPPLVKVAGIEWIEVEFGLETDLGNRSQLMIRAASGGTICSSRVKTSEPFALLGFHSPDPLITARN